MFKLAEITLPRRKPAALLKLKRSKHNLSHYKPLPRRKPAALLKPEFRDVVALASKFSSAAKTRGLIEASILYAAAARACKLFRGENPRPY